jgi:hypothetical protein
MKKLMFKSPRAQLAYAIVLVLSTSAFAADTPANPGKPHHACQKIAQACRDAGFKKGDWKNGDGLWRDCVDPIVQGVSTVPGGTKPLPTVDAAIVADCKAHHPKFGEGKVGSVQNNAQNTNKTGQ